MTWILQDVERQRGVDLEAVEFGLRSRMLEVGGGVLERVMNAGADRGPSLSCACGRESRFAGYREKRLQTVLGTIRVRRAYYPCRACGTGRFPQDEVWDIVDTGFSPGLRRLMSRVGANEPFRQGGEALRELAGVEVETKAVERVAEGVGASIRVSEEVRRAAVLSENVIPLPSAEPAEKVYITLDGTGVPVVSRETVGHRGKGEDGKARTREAKLGCVFTQTGVNEEGKPVRDEASTTYVGVIENAEAFGKELYAEVVRRGLFQAKHHVVIGDGALWIWELAQEHFPHALQIVDLYHAREHLWMVGRAVYGENKATLKSWVSRRIAALDRGDIASIVRAFRRVTVSSEAVRKMLQTEAEYFRKNRHRMQYAQFKKQGVFVGSGVVEAGCKMVIGQRLKQSGMRWSVRGANAIITLRRCLQSGEWEDYWASRATG